MKKKFLHLTSSVLLSIFCLLHSPVKAQDKKATADLRKKADKHFENKEFKEAKKIYAQLTTFYPKDSFYNYRLGACMLIVDPNKTLPLKYLEYAASRADSDPEAMYYLGKGYHLNYRFREAVVYYNKFKEKGSAKQQKTFRIDQQIQMAENGTNLLEKIAEPVVKKKRTFSDKEFYNAYKLSGIKGKYLKVPADIQSDYDKKVKYKGLMYRRTGSDTILFSSYGPNEENGIDLYMVLLSEDGATSEPVRLPAPINTENNERYPFLSVSGEELYFASEGHNSMGGYDIFKSSYTATGWTTPVNLDYMVNTPDNDFLFAVDDSTGIAYFTSDRNNDFGNVSVYEIDPVFKPMSIAVLSGKFSAQNTTSAQITVVDAETDKEVGKFNTAKAGSYLMRLTNGGKYKFLVEPAGSSLAHAGIVELPNLKKARLLKQEMQIVTENDQEKLIIKNLFEEENSAEDDLLLAQELLKSANLSTDSSNTTEELNIDIDEMVATINQKAENIQEQSLFIEAKSKLAFSIASEKAEIAKTAIDRVKELEASMGADSTSAEYRLKLEELNEAKLEARRKVNMAAMAFDFGEELSSMKEQADLDVNTLNELANQAQKAFNAKNRKDVVMTQQESENIQLAEGRDVNDAYIKLRKIVGEKRKLAAEAKDESEKIYIKIGEIEQDLKYYKGQYDNTRDKTLKKTFEEEIEGLELELEQTKTKSKLELDRADKLNKEANQYNRRLAIIDEIFNLVNSTDNPSLPVASLDQYEVEDKVLAQLSETDKYDDDLIAAGYDLLAYDDRSKEPQVGENSENGGNDLAVVTPEDKNEGNTENQQVEETGEGNEVVVQENIENNLAENVNTSENSSEEGSQSKEQRNQGVEANTTKIAGENLAENTNESPSSTNNDEGGVEVNSSGVGNGLVTSLPKLTAMSAVTALPAGISGNISNGKFEEKDEAINSIEDPYEKAQGKVALNEAWIEALNADKTTISEAVISGEVEGEVAEQAISEIEQRQVELKNQNDAYVAQKPELTSPGESYLAFNSINAVEEKFKSDYQNSESLPTRKAQFEKRNELDQAYLDELTAAQTNLKTEQGNVEEGSPRVAEIKAELAALSSVIGQKNESIVDRNGILEAITVTDSQDLVANDQNTANSVAAEGGDVGKADESQDLAQNEISTELTNEENPKGEVDVETPDVSGNEGNEIASQGGNVVEEVTTNTLADQPGYNENYAASLAELENEADPVKKAAQTKKINEDWLSAIEKDIETVSANRATASTTEEKTIADAQLMRLRSDAEEKRLAIKDAQAVLDNGGGVIVSKPQNEVKPGSTTESVESGTTEEGITENSTNVSTSTDQPKSNTEENNQDLAEQNATKPNSNPSTAEVSLDKIPEEAFVSVTEADVMTDLSAKNEIATKGAEELAALKTELANTKKRKKRKALEAQIAEKEKVVARQLAEAQVIYVRAEKIKEAEQQLIQNPESAFLSESYATEAKALSDSASLLEQELVDLKNKLGETKRKKHRRKIEAEIAALTTKAETKRLEANAANQTLALMKDAELRAVKDYSDFGRKVVVDVPKYEANLSESEIKNMKSSEAFQEYEKAKIEYDKKIMQASVLYQSAIDKEQKANSLLEEAKELETNTEQDPAKAQENKARATQLKSEANSLLEESKQEKQEALTNRREGYYAINMANKSLLQLDNEVLRNHILAYTGGNTTVQEKKFEPKEEVPAPIVVTEETVDVIPKKLVQEKIFIEPEQEIQEKAFYSQKKPIPVNVKMPEGLVFKVQIGAFRNQIPQETFKGFAPIVGETTSSGLTRYTAGLFKDFDGANDARKGIRALGYDDAFVVAYNNGKRVSVSQARKILANQSEEQLADGGTTNAVLSSEPAEKPMLELGFKNQDVREKQDGEQLKVNPMKDLPELFFTVQVGVYSKAVSANDLFNITPLNSDYTNNGYIRYSSGIYNSVEAATIAKNKIVKIGIEDAFVTAYFNGKRTTVANALKEAEKRSDTKVNVKPVSNQADQKTEPKGQDNVNTQNPKEQEPKKQNTSNDEASGELRYRVQIGPYLGEVPVREAAVVLEMSKLWIKLRKSGEKTYYTIGNYETLKEAQDLENHLNERGLEKLKVVKYKNGVLQE